MSTSDTAVIKVQQLHKNYGKQAVLNELDLTVMPGELIAILGPNGAGKTTLISTLLGLTDHSAGSISLLGQQQGKFRSQQLKQQLGVMMQVGTASANLTVAEQCDLFSSYYSRGKTAAELLAIAGLQQHAKVRFGKLSGGQKQRLLFALALAGNPKLLFLDEPTLGMDVAARQTLWQQIRELKKAGVSIVLTTHYLQEAEQLADRIMVMQYGRFIAQGSPSELKALSSGKLIRCRCTLSDETLSALPGVSAIQRYHDRITLQSCHTEQTVLALLQADSNVSELEVQPVALEQAFLQLTSQEQVV